MTERTNPGFRGYLLEIAFVDEEAEMPDVPLSPMPPRREVPGVTVSYDGVTPLIPGPLLTPRDPSPGPAVYSFEAPSLLAALLKKPDPFE